MPSRYSKLCPVCGAIIEPHQIRSDSFPCPACSEWLEFAHKYSPAIWSVGAVLAIATCLRLGYRDATFILMFGVFTILFGWAGAFMKGFLNLTKLQRVAGRPIGEEKLSLRLKDVSKQDKKADD